MSPATQVAHFALAQEARSADAIRGDEEVSPPSAAFEQVGDRMVEAHAAIVEGEQRRPFVQIANGGDGRSRGGDGVGVARNLAAEFVDTRAFAEIR
jgi:hypothetical protein